MSQYLVLKHFLSCPETVLFLNDVFWYLYTIYNRQIDFILRVCLFLSVNHFLTTFLILSEIFHIFSISVLHWVFVSFTKVVFIIIILQKYLGTKLFLLNFTYWKIELISSDWNDLRMNSYISPNLHVYVAVLHTTR